MDYALLKDLDCSRNNWIMRVRVCRMWESFNLKTNQLISLDMIFIDEEENMMHASIRKNHVSKYKYLLKEGSIFGIKNFKVAPTIEQYRTIANDYKIYFLVNTCVTKKDEGLPTIPKHGFQFVIEGVIESRINDNIVLTELATLKPLRAERQSK